MAIPKQRESNLELFRILTMLFIIAHHYVVNSALWSDNGPVTQYPMAWKSLFLLIISAFGKTGINCFVIISGYFMSKSAITVRRFAKLYFEVIFYDVVISLIFWITGYGPLGLYEMIPSFFPPAYIADTFVMAFLLLYCCIPFINRLVQNLSQKEHAYMLLLVFMIYIIPETFRFVFHISTNHFSWYIVLYLFAAYIRNYPNAFFENTRFWGICTIVSMLLCACSVVACVYMGIGYEHYFVSDSNTFLAFITAVSAFMYFKNIKIKYNPLINLLASTCFGVLLIHGHSDEMRRWLWEDVLDNCSAYDSNWMIVHVILSTLGVFLVCSGIDLLRQKYLEKPFFYLWDRMWERMEEKYCMVEQRIFRKLNIQD